MPDSTTDNLPHNSSKPASGKQKIEIRGCPIEMLRKLSSGLVRIEGSHSLRYYRKQDVPTAKRSTGTAITHTTETPDLDF
ncbi:MAG: hypothetical protein DSY87_06605 [Methylococcus sp.]|nr:MAG: hypothetical protein DSY87_06605 [Methylococcus sp.]